MGVRFARKGLVLSLAALLLPTGLATANAAGGPVAAWEMNEGSGASMMLDSSGNGNNGVIAGGAAADGLTTGVSLSPGTGYRWGQVQPNIDIKPDRVIRASSPALNPGTRAWEISFRYRTSRPFGNILQKGQSQARGGQIKFQLPRGNVSCMYKDENGGRRAVRTTGEYDNNAWYVVKCQRTSAGVMLRVYAGDGTTLLETRNINGSTGNISNSVPFTVGGKPNCNQDDITCDYFQGEIDWVRVQALS